MCRKAGSSLKDETSKLISDSLQRYYTSIKWAKKKELLSQEKIKRLTSLFVDDSWYTTADLVKSYNQTQAKPVTPRRMNQLLYELLNKQLVNTKMKHTGIRGRFRIWNLKQKNS